MNELYKKTLDSILLIRVVEEMIVKHYNNQEMRCPVHLGIGQEAVAAGVCAPLSYADKVLSGHRNHGHYLAKGGDIKRMFAEIYGKKSGCCKGVGGSMHMTDQSVGFIAATPIVGSTIPIACGVAYHQKLTKQEAVTVVFFGDGATETGVFFESLNLAALKALPVIFVCEDNDYSVYSPKEVRIPSSRNWKDLIEGIGIEYSSIDGQLGHEVVKSAVDARARAVKGCPQFIHAKTFRYREHCGPNFDDDLAYRDLKIVDSFIKRDPLVLMSEKLGIDYSTIVTRCTVLEKRISEIIEEVRLEPV
jgi:TPP-dependent pyruvate/acetoin dehydrogenase alpha subunit